ncbi:FxDxF family PEP-CTERM protein [Sphingomonas sp. A2-49]|uniref:FxDxF family PEP-CTERM protein n=1 Tax=Sphingomonas sp. A2-49 TaxID=1391375 RepID=UPI0021D07083|nr:FxDxF family PEP-CTERM protein [Sphingomonas sp. A2-49]MCU6454122.1 FxDxF family PEP-CTERM protein [Sphingomonas sp. A2-49]
MRFVTLGLIVAGFVGAAAPAAAQSIGDRVTCTATAFTCAPAAAVVGSGIEFAYGPTATPFLNLDFSDGLLSVTGRFSSIQLGAGQSISFRDTTNAFTSATLLSNTNSTLTAADVVFNNGLVTLNVAGRTFNSAGQLRIGLTTLATAVPEPAGWAMLIAGFGLIGFAMRRRGAGPAVARA